MIPIGSGMTTTGPSPVAAPLGRSCVSVIVPLLRLDRSLWWSWSRWSSSCPCLTAGDREVADGARLQDHDVETRRHGLEPRLNIAACPGRVADEDAGHDPGAPARIPDAVGRRNVAGTLLVRPDARVRGHAEVDREVGRSDEDPG